MVKKIIILGILISILILLLIIRPQSGTPVTNDGNDSSIYKTVEYKISKMKDNHFYGVSNDGKKIVFSAESLDTSEEIQVGDVVICYFEKDNVGKGLVKVERK